MKKHPLADLDDDIRDYLDRETQDNIERGMTPEDARAAARRKFGNVALVREDARAVWIPALVDQTMQDVRYAARTLRRQPGFTAAAIFMLAIGLGLVTGGYTVFNGLFVRGWAVPESGRVFKASAERARTPSAGYVPDGFSEGAFAFIRRTANAADYVGYNIDYFRIAAQPGPGGAYSAGMRVSPNTFETLGIPLQLGTGFGGRRSTDPRIVISAGVWQRVFGADPQIVGRTVWISQTAATVVGVTARGFEGLGDRPLDVVVDSESAPALASRRSSPSDWKGDGTRCCVLLAGRLRDGWTHDQAREELQLLTGRYRTDVGQPPLIVELMRTTVGEGLLRSPNGGTFTVALSLAAAGVLLVLLLTCANVGNLHLARSLRREREIAVRLSLGASRARIVRQLLTEGLVIAAAAGACAFAMTAAVPIGLRALEDNITTSMFVPDWRVALFTVAGVVATCLLVSLAPALQTTRIQWRGATATWSRRTGHVRGVVLAAQIAIAGVLVLSATLLVRGMVHAVTSPADFALRTTTAVRLWEEGKPVLGTRVMAVIAAARAAGVPLGLAEAIPVSADSAFPTSVSLAGSDLVFRCRSLPLDAAAMGVLELRLASGRLPSDDRSLREALVNETLARQLWGDGDAIGKSFTLAFDRATYTVVGVTRDAHLISLSAVDAVVHTPPRPNSVYVMLMRTSPAMTERIKAAIMSTDPRLVATFTPLSESVKQTMGTARSGAALAGGLGAVALLLAVVGVFGVFSYLVEERRQEIGIRLALGASRAQIGAALFRATRTAVAGGLTAGLTLSAVAGIALRGYLFGLSPADPVSYGAVAFVLGVAALLATAVPVRRALRVDPAVTLRAE